ncbi:hypothetical protein IJJ97_05800, partial [bacterium]|nr:hypothetical protein [bacterium]
MTNFILDHGTLAIAKYLKILYIYAVLDKKDQCEESLVNFAQELMIPKDSFKYVDRKNGLKHYVLTIDDKFIANTGADLGSEFESFKGMKFNIDFYLTDSNELRKIQVDLKDMLKEKLKDSGITKLLVVVEF